MSRNVARAALWGRPVARARLLASVAVARSISTVTSSSSIAIGEPGSSCRSATARRRTSSIARPPFVAATSSGSTAVATTPCASRPGVVNTTADSPSAGSTPPTYRMNAVLGPTTSTPLRASRSRWV